jgi:hypothetical protein
MVITTTEIARTTTSTVLTVEMKSVNLNSTVSPITTTPVNTHTRPTTQTTIRTTKTLTIHPTIGTTHSSYTKTNTFHTPSFISSVKIRTGTHFTSTTIAPPTTRESSSIGLDFNSSNVSIPGIFLKILWYNYKCLTKYDCNTHLYCTNDKKTIFIWNI